MLLSPILYFTFIESVSTEQNRTQEEIVWERAERYILNQAPIRVVDWLNEAENNPDLDRVFEMGKEIFEQNNPLTKWGIYAKDSKNILQQIITL